MFSNAIVRIPGKSLVNGLTTANLGLPDYEKALLQHQSYVNALIECGLNVAVMPADEEYPDATFVEDAALLTPHCAIIMNPGAASRKGEIVKIKATVSRFFSDIEEIEDPGTAEAGDIMMVGDHYYIGISERTNRAGAEQVIEILNHYGMTGSTIELEDVLHLKTGLAYLENHTLAVCGEFIHKKEFDVFKSVRYLDPVDLDLSLLITDKGSILFLKKDNEIDYKESLYGFEESFINWTKSLFNWYWNKSKIIESK